MVCLVCILSIEPSWSGRSVDDSIGVTDKATSRWCEIGN